MGRGRNALLGGLLLAFTAGSAVAAGLQADGPVWGAGAEGSISLRFDPDGGGVEGVLSVTYHWRCKNGPRDEVRSFEVSRGRVAGDELQATAVQTGSDWPKGYGETCRGATGDYRKLSAEDSLRLVGNLDRTRQVVEGTASRSPTLSWRASWAAGSAADTGPPAPPAVPTPAEEEIDEGGDL